MFERTPADPITATFGIYGPRRGSPRPALDVSLGALRGIPLLSALWDGFQLDAASLSDYPGTQGPPELLAAVAELSRRERRCNLDHADVVLTHGALHGLSVALSTLPAGSPVLFPQPAFGYPSAIAAARCSPVPISWRPGSSVSELLDAVEFVLDRRPGPSAVIACFPSNPSGADPSDREWRRLRDIVARNRSVLVVDDLYRFVAPRALDVLGDDVVLVDSLSKRLGAPGLRLGWIATSGARFGALREAAARTSVGVGRPVAALAEHALVRYLDDPGIATRVRAVLDARRADVRAAFEAVGLTDRLLLSDAGFYACVPTTSADSADLMARLRDRGVIVTAGDALYASSAPPSDSFVRLCLGSDPRVGDAAAIVAEELCRDLAAESHRSAA